MSPKTRVSVGRGRTRDSVPQHYLAVQHAVSQILAEAPTLPKASLKLLQAVCESLNWDVGALWERDAHAGVLRCVEVWCAPGVEAAAFVAATRARTFEKGVGLPGRIWSTQAPAWVPDVLRDANFPRAPFAAKEGLHSAFGFPIVLGGELLGTVEFFSPEIRQPDEELLRLMGSIGCQIGQFIDRQRAYETVRESEARKAAVLQSALDGIITIDHRGRIHDFNPAAERIFGYSCDEVLGREMAELIVPERLRDQHRRGLERYVATGKGAVLGMRIEMAAVRADGTEFPVELSITRIPLSGPPVFTGYLRDITARKQAEREREVLLRREQAARGDAESANRLKDEFLATLSHELRTPLTAIVGWTRMLRTGTLDPAMTGRALKTIEDNASLQARLVGDLLDVSQILSGKFRLDRRRMDSTAILEAALDAVRPAAQAKNVSVTASLDSTFGPVLADPDRLQQAVRNLLSNATEFTPSGGRVDLRTKRHEKGIEITVSDTGQGIEAEFLPFVFDRFRQGDGSTTRAHPGLGLGLAIARHVVEMHGGTVRAFSEGPGRGAVFTVVIPVLEEASASPVSGPAENQMRVDPSALTGLHILVVDDDRDTRHLVAAILKSAGARVTTASGVKEGLAVFAADAIDVVLTDIEMPGQDGYELVRRLRTLEAPGRYTPTIALTAHARSEYRARALAAGCACHITKPFEPAEVVAAIAHLSRRADPSPR
jgi:PAS domain S-box-containing protein